MYYRALFLYKLNNPKYTHLITLIIFRALVYMIAFVMAVILSNAINTAEIPKSQQ